VHRQDVLLAAAAVFQERGYEGATMADIARKVNLTPGSLYHHFPAGKRDLLLEVLNSGLDAVLARLDSILAQRLPPAETLRRMIAAHVEAVTANVPVGAAMVFEIRALMVLDDPARAAFLQRRDAFEACFRQVVDAGIRDGAFRPVDAGIFTKALLGAQNWVSVWYRPQGRLSGPEIAEQMADVFLGALLIAPGVTGHY
jgi:AcrR family transcriptional regulator